MDLETHLDAGRSRVIRQSLRPILGRLCALTEATACYAVLQRSERPRLDIVAALSTDGETGLLAGEAIKSSIALPRHLPRVLNKLELRSLFRPAAIRLDAVLAVPWSLEAGQGWLLVAFRSFESPMPHVPDPGILDLLEHARRTYRDATSRCSRQIERNITEATKRLFASTAGEGVSSTLDAVAASTRWLFDASASYVAVPSGTTDKFAFAATDRIRTSAFRRLSLGPDEGLGGLARRQRGAVRTADYARDPRLRRAPLRETIREGFKSAACTPIVRGDHIEGLIYVAQRQHRSFTDIDLGLLEHFAGHVAEAMDVDRRSRHQTELAVRRERMRLAEELHDSVLPQLLEVCLAVQRLGYASGAQPSEPAVRQLTEKAETCLQAIRACIADRSGASARLPISVGAVVADWQGLSLKPGTTLEIDLGHGCELHRMLAGPQAEALLAIGREAIVNANRHATGQRICVRLAHEEGTHQLSVEDDGKGGDLDWLQARIGKPGHLGLSLMQARAQALGGRVSLGRSQLGGVRVSVALPAVESR